MVVFFRKDLTGLWISITVKEGQPLLGPVGEIMVTITRSPNLPFAYSVNQYGIIQDPNNPPNTKPDPIPYLAGSEWHGLRINLELLDPNNAWWTSVGVPDNNVQTFLSVLGEGAPLFAPASNGSWPKKPSNTKVTLEPGRSKVLQHMKARLDAYRKKQGSKK